MLDKLLKLISAIVYYAVTGWNEDRYLPEQALLEFPDEHPHITREREEAIAWLRSHSPSKYVLDGAQVSWVMGVGRVAPSI